MRSHTVYLSMNVPARMDFVNITADVEAAVKQSGVREGLCLVNAMHITASVFINDDEPGLQRDYKKWLEELAPFDPSPERYHHNRTGEDNADAHHKRQLNYYRLQAGRFGEKSLLGLKSFAHDFVT